MRGKRSEAMAKLPYKRHVAHRNHRHARAQVNHAAVYLAPVRPSGGSVCGSRLLGDAIPRGGGA